MALPDQVGEYLAQPAGVADLRLGQAGVDVARQLDALLVRAAGQQDHHVLDHLARIEALFFEFQLAGLDFREVEDVVDDRQQRLPGVVDGLREALLLVRQRGVEQEFGHAEDAVHRRADLVAHVGQEARLGDAGGLGHFLGLGQRLLDPLAAGDVAADAAIAPEYALAVENRVAADRVPDQLAALVAALVFEILERIVALEQRLVRRPIGFRQTDNIHLPARPAYIGAAVAAARAPADDGVAESLVLLPIPVGRQFGEVFEALLALLQFLPRAPLGRQVEGDGDDVFGSAVGVAHHHLGGVVKALLAAGQAQRRLGHQHLLHAQRGQVVGDKTVSDLGRKQIVGEVLPIDFLARDAERLLGGAVDQDVGARGDILDLDHRRHVLDDGVQKCLRLAQFGLAALAVADVEDDEHHALGRVPGVKQAPLHHAPEVLARLAHVFDLAAENAAAVDHFIDLAAGAGRRRLVVGEQAPHRQAGHFTLGIAEHFLGLAAGADDHALAHHRMAGGRGRPAIESR